MLPLYIPERELWDEAKQEIIYTKSAAIHLEHSLISISNWEMKWHVPYFDEMKTDEQALDYIKCMTIEKNIDDSVYLGLTMDNIKAINEYMLDPMTATTIFEIKDKQKPKQKKITSELIYYWMIQFGIPFTCEKWHINRLIMLIRVCSEENKPKKKRSAQEIAAEQRALNAARRAKYNTKG